MLKLLPRQTWYKRTAITAIPTRLLNTQHARAPPKLMTPRSPFSVPSPTPKIQFARLDFEEGLQSVVSSPLPRYRCKYFMLRCVPASKVTPPRHPFPAREPSNGREKVTIRFGIVTSKKAISKFAVERSKVRTLFKSAVDEVLREDKESGGKGLIKPDKVYLAILYGDLLSATRNDLLQNVSQGLKFVARPPVPKMSVPTSDVGRSTRYTPPNR